MSLLQQTLTLNCFAADAASAAVAVATTCFWDSTWPHVLVVHPVHPCNPVHLLPGLQAAEMAMVLFQHHHLQATNFIADSIACENDILATPSDLRSLLWQSDLSVIGTLSASNSKECYQVQLRSQYTVA